MVEMLSFAVMLLVASIPVPLPATFTLATALGSLELAANGVLVTRLSAIEEPNPSLRMPVQHVRGDIRPEFAEYIRERIAANRVCVL